MIKSRCTSRPSLSIGLDRSIKAVGSGWRGGNGAGPAKGLRGVEVDGTVGNVMLGLSMDVFIDVNRYGLHGRSQRDTGWCHVSTQHDI